MKHFALALAIFGFYSAAHAVDCAPGLKSAYSLSIQRFRVGELTLADVAEAESNYKMKLLSCTPVTAIDDRLILCSEASNAARLALWGTEQEAQVGSRTDADVALAKQRVADTNAACTTRP